MYGFGFLIDGIDSYDLYIYMTMIHVNCFLYVFVTIGQEGDYEFDLKWG